MFDPVPVLVFLESTHMRIRPDFSIIVAFFYGILRFKATKTMKERSNK